VRFRVFPWILDDASCCFFLFVVESLPFEQVRSMVDMALVSTECESTCGLSRQCRMGKGREIGDVRKFSWTLLLRGAVASGGLLGVISTAPLVGFILPTPGLELALSSQSAEGSSSSKTTSTGASSRRFASVNSGSKLATLSSEST
jgi:hypothetical protein